MKKKPALIVIIVLFVAVLLVVLFQYITISKTDFILKTPKASDLQQSKKTIVLDETFLISPETVDSKYTRQIRSFALQVKVITPLLLIAQRKDTNDLIVLTRFTCLDGFMLLPDAEASYCFDLYEENGKMVLTPRVFEYGTMNF